MGQKTIIFFTVLTIITVALIIVFVVTRLISDDRGPNDIKGEVNISETITSTKDILDTPIVFENKNLAVEADMVAWVTKDSFTLSSESNGRLGGDTQQLWIIFGKDFDLPHKSDPSIPGFGELKKVRVTGLTRILNREEMERLLNNGLDDPKLFLDDNKIATDWEYGIVIIGESVEIIE